MQLPPTPAQRVLIVDDQLLVRAGVAALLAQIPGCVCVGAVADAQGTLRACDELQPDDVLLDLHLAPSVQDSPSAGGALADLQGLALARVLRELHPRLRILVLSGRTQPEVVRAALRAGALAFIGKDFVLDELRQALHSVRRGQRWISPAIAAALQAQERMTPALTARQREVLALLARGQANKQIARTLGVSVKTVEYHRAELIARLDLHDVASLTRFAVAQGLAG